MVRTRQRALDGRAQAWPRRVRGLAGWIGAALLSILPLPASAVHSPPAFRPPMVVVRALGPMDPEEPRQACRRLLEAFAIRCQVGEPRALVEVFPYWNAERSQLDARATLDALFRTPRDPEGLIELDLTHLDIFEGDKPFVFGLASLTDRVAIVSLARIRNPGDKFGHRLAKLVRHEVAHTLGLHHHAERDCVMRQDPTPESLDTAPTRPCPRCHQSVQTQLARLSRPGQRHLDASRGHLVRGDLLAARAGVAAALRARIADIGLYEDFALAFLESGAHDEAIALLRYVLRRDPDRAQAQLKLAWAFQQRGRDGDHERALAQLEGVLILRPDWTRLEDQLATLRAQGPQASPRPRATLRARGPQASPP